MAEKGRDFGLDLVRASAGVLVLAVHFFLNNGFYSAVVEGKSMLLACIVRMACMTCVPLFMVLSGYLCIKRTWGPGYYRKLWPILLAYLLAAAVCMAFRWFWLGEVYPAWTVVQIFTTYAAAPYAWYIEMYIGLFLLSPFFNAAWNNLDVKAQRALMITLIVLTSLPSLVNQVGQLLPDWWIGFYPLAYYAVGAWLRDHPIRLDRRLLLLVWLAVAAVMGIKGYMLAAGGTYKWMPDDNWRSPTLMLQAVCLFSCLREGGGTVRPVRCGGAWLGWPDWLCPCT